VVVVLLEAVCVLLSRVRKPAGRDDHPAFGAVEVEGRYGGVELLDDGASDRPRVLTLDDDRTPRSVDDLLHKDIATLVSRAVGLADVLVAEVTEHVLDHILELEPERSSSTAIPNYVDSTLQLSNTLPNAASLLF